MLVFFFYYQILISTCPQRRKHGNKITYIDILLRSMLYRAITREASSCSRRKQIRRLMDRHCVERENLQHSLLNAMSQPYPSPHSSEPCGRRGRKNVFCIQIMTFSLVFGVPECMTSKSLILVSY